MHALKLRHARVQLAKWSSALVLDAVNALSEVVDAPSSAAEVEPTAGSDEAEPDDAPAVNEVAEEGEEPEDVEESAKPVEEPLEKAVSEARPEEPTAAGEPAAQAP